MAVVMAATGWIVMTFFYIFLIYKNKQVFSTEREEIDVFM